MLLNVTSIRA